jgi:hypothetical protein
MNLAGMEGIFILIQKTDEVHDYVQILDLRGGNTDRLGKNTHNTKELLDFIDDALISLLGKPVSNRVDTAEDLPKDMEGWIKDFEKRGIK